MRTAANNDRHGTGLQGIGDLACSRRAIAAASALTAPSGLTGLAQTLAELAGQFGVHLAGENGYL